LADVVGLAFAGVGAFGSAGIFRHGGFSAGFFVVLAFCAAPTALVAYVRARRSRLVLDADGTHVAIRCSRWPRRPVRSSVRLDALETVDFEGTANDHFRVLVRTRDGLCFPLSEGFDLDGGELRRELARVQRFLLPARPIQPIPESVPGAPVSLARSLARVGIALLCIFGPCAALGVYGTMRQMNHSKSAEASRYMAVIEGGARRALEEGTAGPDGRVIHAFCPSAPQTPAVVPRGTSWTAEPGQLEAAGWRCLGFSVSEPLRYAYRYESNYPATGSDAVFTATALGDLDGDGELSSFVLIGRGTVDGTLRRESFRITNEDE
jgi:hypothetical protein